jgi:RNA ligase
MRLLDKTKTYIFEAIYPENRIVVDYGSTETLMLTGIRDHNTGEESSYADIMKDASRIGCGVVKQFAFNSMAEMFAARELLTVNEEGFVITYENGFKFKLKGEEYCKVHRAVSNMTPLHYWRAMDLETLTVSYDFLKLVPEEFRDDSDKLQELIESAHVNEFTRVVKLVETVPKFKLTTEGKKARYKYISENYNSNDVGLILGLINNAAHKVKLNIHRAIRPTRNVMEGIGLSDTFSNMINNSEE